MRYFAPRRIELYRRLVNPIQKQDPRIPVYLCMETEEVWKDVFGEVPPPSVIRERLDQAVFIS
jgi:hypothetical protein